MVQKKNAKTESALSSMEVLLSSLDPTKLGIDIMLLQAGCDVMLAILRQENMWICDTGVGMHVTWSNKVAKSVHNTKLYSLCYAGSALECTALTDIPGVFVTKDGKQGLQAVLKDFIFNGGYNFSMSKLLHKQGWGIMCGDELLIRMRGH